MQHLIYDGELGHRLTKCCIFPQCETRLAFAIESSASRSYSLEERQELLRVHNRSLRTHEFGSGVTIAQLPSL